MPVGAQLLRSTPLPAKLGSGAQVKSGSGDQVKSGSSAHVDLPTGLGYEDQPSQSSCDLGSKLSPGSHPSVGSSAQSPPAPSLGFSPEPTLGFNPKTTMGSPSAANFAIGQAGRGQLKEIAWGVPRPPESFVKAAVSAGHPRLFDALLPRVLDEAVKVNATASCEDLAASRTAFFKKWTAKAAELAGKESELQATCQNAEGK